MSDRVGEGQAGPSELDKTLAWADAEITATRASEARMLRRLEEANDRRRASEAALAEKGARITALEVTLRAYVASTESLRKQLESARAEAPKAEDALRQIRDAHADECGCDNHAGENCCNRAEEPCAFCLADAAIRAPQPPEPESGWSTGDSTECGCGVPWSAGIVHNTPKCRTPPPPSAPTWHWSTDPDGPEAPPPSEWKEPTKGSMTVGDLPYVLCPKCQKRLPRAGWEHTCKAPPPSEEPRPCPTDSFNWCYTHDRPKADCAPVPSPSPTRDEPR